MVCAYYQWGYRFTDAVHVPKEKLSLVALYFSQAAIRLAACFCLSQVPHTLRFVPRPDL